MVRHRPGVIVYGFTLQVSGTLELTGSACLREQSFNATPMHSLVDVFDNPNAELYAYYAIYIFSFPSNSKLLPFPLSLLPSFSAS